MIVAVPTEIKAQENRVGLVPSGVKALVANGHRVLVQQGAGNGSGLPDDEYIRAGAEIVIGDGARVEGGASIEATRSVRIGARARAGGGEVRRRPGPDRRSRGAGAEGCAAP